MARFEVTTLPEVDQVVVALAGDCDMSVSDGLADALFAALNDFPVVVVDVSALDFLDSSGVNSLVTAHHAALDRGGHLYLTGAKGMVATVLDITGIGALLSPSADSNRPAEG
jgi:anti-sigma B factor antagonist